MLYAFKLQFFAQDDAISRSPINLIAAFMIKKLFNCVFICSAVGVLSASLASAQLVLPGARAPTPLGAEAPAAQAQPNAVQKKKAPVNAYMLKPPSLKTVLASNLELNGKSGKLTMSATHSSVNVTTLILRGTKISNPDQFCQVSILSGAPILATPSQGLRGADHYSVDIPACPFEFDVLDGALLVSARPKSCKLVTADCAVDPSGLWGPSASSQGPQQAKSNEIARAHAELEMRAQFRALMKRTHGHANLEAVATEQAGFSSFRATVCRNYAGDSVQDFCALKLTQMRAVQLNDLVRAAPANEPHKGKAKNAKLRGRGKYN